MTNIISLNTKRKASPLIRIVQAVLDQNQSIVIGTSHIEHRMKELESWFPEAKLEAVELGIKICNRK